MYKDCFIGQSFGEGWVSFDQCQDEAGVAPGSFACKWANCGDYKNKCQGAHSHIGCNCTACSLKSSTSPEDYQCRCI